MGGYPVRPTFPVDVRVPPDGALRLSRRGAALELDLDADGLPVSTPQAAALATKLNASAAGLSVKANLLSGVAAAQDTSLAAFGAAVSLGRTQADLSTFMVRLASVRVAGFSGVGDVGDGAIYVSSNTASGPRSISNGMFFWNLTFPGDVYAGHFGVGLGGTDDAGLTAAGNYAIANNRRLVLPNRVMNVNAWVPTFPINSTPFSPGRLWVVGGGPGISTLLKVAGGDTNSPLQIGDNPSTAIKKDVILEGFTIDGRATTTFAALTMLDIWQGTLRRVECRNANIGYQALGCIYLTFDGVNCHANNYGHVATKFDQSYFRPLIGPANLHTHVNCLYTENYRRGAIVDWGGMHTYVGCSIEYNGSVLGNSDHGGIYIGPNMGFAVPGTTFVGVKLVTTWFENNYGSAQIELGSGSLTLDGVHFIVPPNFTTYGLHNLGGKYSIQGCTTFAAAFTAGNVRDEAGALSGSRIEWGCSLYNVFVDPKKVYIERIPGTGSTVRAPSASIPNDTFPPVAINWTGLTVDNTGGHFNPAQPSRLTILEAGRYRFNGYVRIATNGAGSRQIKLARNGSYAQEEWEVTGPGTGSLATSLPFSSLTVDAVAGDYFEIFPYQNSGAPQAITGGAFQLERIR